MNLYIAQYLRIIPYNFKSTDKQKRQTNACPPCFYRTSEQRNSHVKTSHLRAEIHPPPCYTFIITYLYWVVKCFLIFKFHKIILLNSPSILWISSFPPFMRIFSDNILSKRILTICLSPMICAFYYFGRTHFFNIHQTAESHSMPYKNNLVIICIPVCRTSHSLSHMA